MANEKRLIDANAAVELLRRLGSRDYRREKGTIADAMKMLSHPAYTPTVDAVEVVRCKDCKWYKEGELLAPNKFCFRLKHPTEDRNVGYNFCDDDFCSYGERKDNG